MSYLSRLSLYVLTLAFLLTGILARDVWHGPEAYTFGPIYHFYHTNSWLIPVNAGTPFLEKPPIYYWTGVIFAHLFGALLPLHEAARLATVFYITITMAALWKTSEVLFADMPERKQTLPWIVIALSLGSVTLAKDAHLMEPDVPLLAGSAVLLYGLSRLMTNPDRYALSGLWIGLGTGIAFLAKGLFIPAVFGIAIAAIWACMKPLHTRRTVYCFLIALAAASPFLFIWPTLLYLQAPNLFIEWFWNNNIGRFLGFAVKDLGAANSPFMILRSAPGDTFPLFLLSLVAIFHYRKEWRKTWFLLPAAISIIGLLVLTLSATARAYYLLPLTPAFALLAAQGIYCLPQWFLLAWGWLLRIVIPLFLGTVWLEWWNLKQPESLRSSPWITHSFSRWIPPEYIAYNSACLPLLALSTTLCWVVITRLPMRTPQNTALQWFAGIATIWITVSALLDPWLALVHSDRTRVTAVLSEAKTRMSSHDCLYPFYSEIISPVFDYVAVTSFPEIRLGGPECRFAFMVHNPDLTTKEYNGYSIVWRSGTSPYFSGSEFWLMQKR